MNEFKLIKHLKQQFKYTSPILLGIGDDAAVLQRGSTRELLTLDVMVERIDFTFKQMTPEAVGRKALAINLSDIAAMGAKADTALVGLVLPKKTPLNKVKRFTRGLRQLANRYGVKVIGGDLSAGPCWMTSVVVTGHMDQQVKPVVRSGARVGDFIVVTGRLGGSLKGKHWSFAPRLAEGQWLARFGVHAMIDISDGLVQDLKHLLKDSRKGADIDLSQIPLSIAAHQMHRDKQRALECALSDGEDFELLFTINPRRWRALVMNWKKRFRTPITAIGHIVRGQPKIVFRRDQKRVKLRLKQEGFDHFQ